MSSEECHDGSATKKARLSPVPVPGPSPSTSWTPSAPEPEFSCDSGVSESGLSVATPPVPGAGPSVEDEDSLSGLSDMSGQEWKPDMSSKLSWLHSAMRRGEDPREILINLLPSGSEIPQLLDNMTMWKVLFNLLSEPPRRKKLENVNTLEDCVELIKKSSNIIILTGAGVSVSCGIPDFRSRDGVYARLAVDFPDLPDPQAMFDIHYFKKDPRPFFKFAREIYPGQFQPSPCHKFIRCVETSGKLLRNYTQNIDTLEQVAGIENVIQCHGSFATASCMVCRRKVDAESIRSEIFNQTIPKCELCPEPVQPTEPTDPSQQLLLPSPPVQLPVMKPDIVFFGEGLPDHFHDCISRDKSECDLLIVIGSSLKVRPVALIPSSLPPEVPQILINRETLPHLTFDVELLGDCDRIINQLCLMLEEEQWQGPVHQPRLKQHLGLPQQPLPPTDADPEEQLQPDQNSQESQSTGEEGTNPSEPVKQDSDTSEVDKDVELTVREPQPCQSSEGAENGTDDFEKEKGSPSGPANEDVEEMKLRSLADIIPEGNFLYLPPSRYIFPGAEIDHDDSDDDDDGEEEEDEDDDEEEGGGNEEDVVNNEGEVLYDALVLHSETVQPEEI